MDLSARDVEHVFQQLRSGTVPERSLEAFAVGIERQREELGRIMTLAEKGEGTFKFLRGGYGCGKTFLARLSLLDAQRRGFATSFVVVSDNDLHFHRFDELYRKVMQELGTRTCPRAALADVVDRWVGHIEEGLIAAGEDDGAPDFDRKVEARLEENLTALSRGKAPRDMARALRAVFQLKQQGKLAEAGAILSWLSGSTNVSAASKRLADVKGEIGSAEAMDYLHGVVEIVKAAGYTGLCIVIDEAETILRMRNDVRGKSLNGIRQIVDMAPQYPGLLWIFTGTPEFFDTKRGVAGLAPLHDRIRFSAMGDKVSVKQPQLDLRPFDRERLEKVALRLLSIYPARNRPQLLAKLPAEIVLGLVDKVTAGFAGDVGVVPRQFLRTFVEVMELADEHPDFDPVKDAGIEPKALSEAERRILAGQPPYDPEPGDDRGYPEYT
jgi:hypothetical protein